MQIKEDSLLHWWELPSECPIKIEEEYLKGIINRTDNYYIKKRVLESLKNKKKCLKNKTFERILKYLKIKLDKAEDKITHIKSHNKLIRVKFPIKESYLHIQILAHTMFDGTKEKRACLRYKVRNDIPTKELFKELLIKCFGKNCYGHTDNCYFLYKSFSELLAKHYKITDFNSKRTYLSKKMLNLAKAPEFRRAILRAAFIDEGYSRHNTTSKNHEKFRLTLVSSIKNKRLAKQLVYLTNLENYTTSMYSCRNDSEHTIAILTKSKRDFYNDIIKCLPNNHRKKIEAENALNSTKSF